MVADSHTPAVPAPSTGPPTRLRQALLEVELRYRAQLQVLDAALAEGNAELQDLRSQIEAMEGTLVWRTGERLRAIREALVPTESVRRRSYDAAGRLLA